MHTILTRLSLVVALATLTSCVAIDDFSKFEEGPGTDAGDVDAGDVDAGPTDGGMLDDGRVCGPETCNGVDDDCDGTVDEEPTECSFPNAVVGCVSGSCQMTGCDDGFGDCEASAGCETDLRSSTIHCGTCLDSCGWGETCQDRTCARPAVTDVLVFPSTDFSAVGGLLFDSAGSATVLVGNRGTVMLPGDSIASSNYLGSVVRLTRPFATAWKATLDASTSSALGGVALGPTGTVVVSGSFDGMVTVGGTSYDSAPATPAGLIWTLESGGADRSFGHYRSTDVVTARSLAVSGNRAYLVGYVTGTNFEGITSLGMTDAFLVRRDLSSGMSTIRLYGGPDMDRLDDVAVSASGRFVVAGGHVGSAEFGGTIASDPSDNSQALVVVYDDLDSIRWNLSIGNANLDLARAVAFDASENVYWAADVGGSVDVGGGPTAPIDAYNTIIGSHTIDRGFRWTTQFRNITVVDMVAGVDAIYVVASVTDGDISPDGMIPFSGDRDTVAIALDAADGRVRWVTSWGGLGSDQPTVAALDETGALWVGGYFRDSIVLDGMTYTPTNSEGYILRVAP